MDKDLQQPPPPDSVLAPSLADQGLKTPATTTATTMDVIGISEGAFTNLGEQQRLKWQDMFDDISIPDQLDRAAAWLMVNTAEREAIEQQGEGFGAFIVRWLLREARGDTRRAKGGTDS
jgi:hypothetical protein